MSTTGQPIGGFFRLPKRPFIDSVVYEGSLYSLYLYLLAVSVTGLCVPLCLTNRLMEQAHGLSVS